MKLAVMAYFKVISQHSCGDKKKKKKNFEEPIKMADNPADSNRQPPDYKFKELPLHRLS